MTEQTAVAEQPTHIPDEVVYDFDIFRDPGLQTDPHKRVREMMKAAPPVFWTPRNGGHWVVAGHPEIFEASRDTVRFSSEFMARSERDELMALLPPDMPHIPQPTPINMDPPEHTQFRAPLNPVFSPKAMKARKDEIRELADKLIDAVVDKGACDFISDIAEPLPVTVFLKMMGLPLERLAAFRELVHEFLAPGMGDPMESVARMRKVADSMKDVIEARKTDPKDDLISLLWQTEINGEPMTFDTMEDYGVLLFIAGLDTVINGMGFGIRHMALNPDFQNELRADPDLIPDAIDELLRRYTFTIPVRRVAEDTELAGVKMKSGDRMMLYLPAADLDEREYPDPEKFDVHREGRAHVAFGVGPHRCLGSHLARVELQIIYEQMLSRLPTFRIDESKPVKFHSGNIIAVDSLPLRWD